MKKGGQFLTLYGQPRICRQAFGVEHSHSDSAEYLWGKSRPAYPEEIILAYLTGEYDG